MATRRLDINDKGHLVVSGVDTVLLVRKFGTPLILLDGAEIEARAKAYCLALRRSGVRGKIFYASKANCTVGLLKKMAKLGLGIDVASEGELMTALRAGCSTEWIVHHGNNKSKKELKASLKAKVGRIVVDSESEVANLLSLARYDRGTKLLLRITPQISPETHQYISTGQIDSKFGFLLDEVMLSEAIQKLSQKFSVTGLHCHIGSQILSTKSFKQAARVMVKWMQKLSQKTGVVLRELNLGGGLGVRYQKEDHPVSIETFVKDSVSAVKSACQKHAFPLPKIFFEPGRSIVGPAGVTLYRVGVVKTIPELRSYIAVDGGMTDNPRVALYGAHYTFYLANRAREKRTKRYSISGRCCEMGDMLGWDVLLPEVQVGDILAVFTTGAYTYSMASNYNRLGKPPQLWVKKGKVEQLSKRESIAHLLSLDA